ncbi:MAG: hypothetical protein LBK70_03650 [Clostridiales bacterium]|jgi:hypothetical protein|nr:hypothetical protein [Clostridiales bacterium]
MDRYTTAEGCANLIIDYTIKQHEGYWIHKSSNLWNKYMSKIPMVAKKLDNDIELAHNVIDILMVQENEIVSSYSVKFCISFGYRTDEAFSLLDTIMKNYKYDKCSPIESRIAFDLAKVVDMVLLVEGCLRLAKDQQNLEYYDLKWLRKRYGKYIENPWYELKK